MNELTTVVTRKGQITLPAPIRRSLDIRQGDKIVVSIDDDDQSRVVLRPVRSVAELTFGAVEPRQRPEDLDALRRQFEEGSTD
jgi:AbrB family looped-hinge helix DNA binding protein